MVTALNVYGTNAASGTLATAAKLASALGGAATTVNTTINTGSGYYELLGLGGTSNAVGSLPSPTDKGWLWDVTTLEANSLQSGTYTLIIKLAVGSGTLSATNVTVRAYKRSGGTYTSITLGASSSFTVTTTATAQTITVTGVSLMGFVTGDKLYIDAFLQAAPVSGRTISVTVSSTSSGVANDLEIDTPGYDTSSVNFTTTITDTALSSFSAEATTTAGFTTTITDTTLTGFDASIASLQGSQTITEQLTTFSAQAVVSSSFAPPPSVGVWVAINGNWVMIREGSFDLDDSIGQMSTCMFTVRDDTGTQHYSKGMSVLIYDYVKGLLFTGRVSAVIEQNIVPNPLIFAQVSCQDNHALPDRRTYQGPEFTNTPSGFIVTELLNTLTAEGITAAYASRRETTQAQLGAGTLTNTTAANNVGDGDLELAPAGAALNYTESATADFSAGTLTNVTAASNTLQLTSTPAIKFTGLAEQGISGGSSTVFVNRKIWSGSISMLTTDVLAYDIWISSSSPEIKASCMVGYSDGTYMDALGFDLEALLPGADTDLSGYARDQWYQRQILTGAGSTKTVTSVVLSFKGTQAGQYTAYFRNIRILSSVGALKTTIFNGTLNKNSTVNVTGYANVTATVVTSYEQSGSRISSAISANGVGIARTSQMDFSATTPTGTACTIDASIDIGVTWTNVPNHSAISSLLAGMSLTGRSLYLRETLSITGSDPTVTPVLKGVTLQVTPSYVATKSDIIRTRDTQADFNLGTLSNTKTLSAGGVTLNGVQENWDEVLSVTNNPIYSAFGTTIVAGNTSTSYKDYAFSLSGASTGDGRIKFDWAGQWADFTLDIDLLVDTRLYGVVYRTTNWNNADGSFAYAAMVSTTEVRLEKGSNSGSTNSKATIVSVPYSTTAGGWHRMRVIASGTNHKIYIDDVLYVNQTDATFTAQGYIGGRIYTPLTSFCNWFGDNFGVVASLTGTWTDTTLSLNSLGTTGGSILLWDATVPDTATLDVQVTLNGGSTWTSCTNGATIPGLTAGTSVSGVSMQLRANFTVTEAGFPLTLNAITAWVMGTYSSSGTRVGPSLPLLNVGRLGNSLVQWNALTLTGTTLGVDVAVDGGAWTDVTSGNGGSIPGLNGQPNPTIDSFNTNTSANYTTTFRTGGSVPTIFYDIGTASRTYVPRAFGGTLIIPGSGINHSRITLVGGSRGLYIANAPTVVGDLDAWFDFDQSDSGGFVWHYLDQSNFYEVAIGDSSSSVLTPGTVTLWSVVANVRTQRATASLSFTRGTFHRYHLNMQAGVITIEVDGVQAFSWTDSSPLAGGKVGLRNGGGTSRCYGIWVQPLGDDVTSHTVQSRFRLASTNPLYTPQVTDTVLAAFGNSIGTGATIPQTNMKNKFLSTNFDDIAKANAAATGTQWWWYIDRNLKFFMLPQTGTPAPWIASDNPGDFQLKGLQVTSEADLYCNSQRVTNVLQTTAVNESRLGDGTAQSWTFAYEWTSAPTITVNGVAATVGVKNVDTGRQFYYAVGDKSIIEDASGPIYDGTQILNFQGTGQYLTDAAYDDVAEQALNALREVGTSGIVEGAPIDGTGLTYAQGLALATATVTKNKVRGRMIDATTLHYGLQPGHLLPVFLTAYGIFDELYLIRNVKTKLTSGDPAQGQTFWQTIQAISGPDRGDFMRLYQQQ